FSIRRALMNGATPREAAIRAVRNVGPACALTSLTTALALFAMVVTDSSLIQQFGIGAGMATLLAFLAVITIVPTVTVLVCREVKPEDRDPVSQGDGAAVRTQSRNEMAAVAGSASGIIERIEQRCRSIARWVTGRQRAIVAVTIPFFVLCLALHLSLEPNYALSDEVPTTNSSIKTAKLLEARLSGAQPLHIMVTWPEGETITSPRVRAALEQVHDLQSRQPAVTNVWSVDTLRRWLVENDAYTDEKFLEYIADLPEHLRLRFLNEDARALVVTGRVGTVNASDSVPIMGRIDDELAAVRKAYPDFTFDVSGFVALSSMASSDMISQLKLGLLTAIVIVVVLIGVAFRSFYVALISFIPNLLPIVLAGSFLFMTGSGLAYASVVALTVAFGLAVDDTIHFLSRFDKERRKAPDMTAALAATLEKVGPVLVLTTLVLLSGLAVTVFSALPALQTFGTLVMVTLGAALVADLFALPALMLVVDKLRPKAS
ncbi:MAG: MMPL family transporter, partial [Pseudomonadota bacterium]